MKMKFISKFTMRTLFKVRNLFAQKKTMAYLLILALFLPMISPGFGGKAYVKASENEEGNDLGNIFTFESLKYGKSDDTLTSVSGGAIIMPADNTILLLEYKWDTENMTVNPGDWASIMLPEQLKLPKDILDEDIITYDEEGEPITVGKFSVIGGLLKFIFNDNLINSTVSNGYVGLKLNFNMESFEDNVVQEIEFNDKVNKTITLALKPEDAITSIEKMAPIPDGGYADAKEIFWAIEILNAEGTPLENAKVLDNIPIGLELKEGSVKIYDLTMGYDGKGNKGAESDTLKYSISTDDGLVVDFPQVDIYKGYRIEYITEITDFAQAAFTNDAKLLYDDLEDFMPAEATVSGITRSGSIEKYGNKVNDFQTEWWIDVNKGGIPINNVIVADNLPEGHTITPDSIEIYILNKSGANWNQGTKVTPDPKPTGFPIELGNIASTQAYRIRYKTDIDYAEVNEGIYQVDNLFANTAVLKSGDDEISQATKEVPITRDSIITKTGNHNDFSYDEASKKLSWKIDINKARHDLKGISVEDLIPTGLDIETTDIVVKNVTTNSIVENPTININDVEGGKKVEIILGDIGTNQYEITYSTAVMSFNIDSINNKAIINGTGVGIGPGTEDNPIIETVSIPNNEYNKNFISVDYNEKTILWELVIVPRREPIASMEITDTFPNGGMILLNDSENPLKVFHGSTKLDIGTHYTLNPHTAGGSHEYNTGFILKFDDDFKIENQIKITYKTSFDPEKGAGAKADITPYEYKNSANFYGNTEQGHTIDQDRSAGTGVEVGSSFNSGKKDGKLVSMKPLESGSEQVNGWVSGNERQIEWEVYINYLKQNLGMEVSVEDSWDYDGELVKESIQIKKYTVNPDGTTNITSEILASSNYDVIPASGGKGFTVNFKPEYVLNERYVIIYKTKVPDISQENYTNTANVIVEGIRYPYSKTINYSKHDNYLTKDADGNPSQTFTDDELTWKININESLSVIENAKVEDTISPGLVYINDSLKVYEYVNGAATEKILNTDYTLNKDILDGKTKLTIEFSNTIASHYLIEYRTAVTATSGSVNNSVEFTGKSITVTPITTEELTASQMSFVGGNTTPNRGEIRIDKINSESKALINLPAKFRIYYKLNGVDTPLGTGEYSTENGKILLNNLPYRTYYIEEIEAPKGYEEVPINPEIYEIVLNSSNRIAARKDANLKVENRKVKTDISVRKEWDGGPKPDVTISLLRDGNKVDEILLTKDNPVHTWTGLDKTDIDGNVYTYSVYEENVPENYTPQITGTEETGFTITNTYTSPKIEVTGNKVWEGGGPDVKPDIQLQLYQNGQALGKPITLTDGETSYIWRNLDETDPNGVLYSYTVDEVEVPTHYGKEISEDGLTITNVFGSEKSDVIGYKNWLDGPEEKPTILLQLYRNGEKYGEAVSLESGKTNHVWKSLDIVDEKGIPYIYTVDEVKVPDNYIKTSKGDSQTVTNQYVIPKTEITGTKVWAGKNGVKPEIKIQLYRDGEVLGTPVTLQDGETSHTWTELDKTDINGKVYKYTIDEVEVPRNYRKTISEDGLTITNTYVDPYVPVVPTPEPPEEPEKPTDPETPEETETPDKEEPETPDETEIPDTKEPETPEEPEIPETEEPTKTPSYKITEVPNPNDPDSPDEFILIDDNDVPQGRYTKVKQPDGSFIYVDDNEVPFGTIIKKLPKTGEKELWSYYLIGIFAALVGMMVLTFKRKKEKEQSDN